MSEKLKAAQRDRVNTMKGEELASHMTSTEFAAYLGINPRRFRRWQASGKIPKPATHTAVGYGLWSPEQQLDMMKRITNT
jgi:DNA-binding transcriptional regulator YiaG